jgi:cytoskeletal protein RodZ
MKALSRIVLVLSLQGVFLSHAFAAGAIASTPPSAAGTANSPAATSVGVPPAAPLPAKGPAVKADTPAATADKPPVKNKVPAAVVPSQASCDAAAMQCATNKCGSTSSSSVYSECLHDECGIANAACTQSLNSQRGN